MGICGELACTQSTYVVAGVVGRIAHQFQHPRVSDSAYTFPLKTAITVRHKTQKSVFRDFFCI